MHLQQIFGVFSIDSNYLPQIMLGSRRHKMTHKTVEEYLECRKEIIEASLTNDELRSIIELTESKFKRKEAGKKLLGQKPSNEDILCIMISIESLRNEAWHKLKNQNPSNKDLRYIIRHLKHTNIQKEAKKILDWKHRIRML